MGWRTRILILTVLAIASAIQMVSITKAFPSPPLPWLSYKGEGNAGTAGDYYQALQMSNLAVPATLSQWKATYGFISGADETSAVYYNANDLGFGREMHCRKIEADVACYVVNHGLGPGGPPNSSVEDAALNQNIIATVAMVYKNSLNGTPNDVSFYVYGPPPGEVLLKSAALDSQGEKFVPQLCLPCHGGSFDEVTKSVSDASFLPFDAPAFEYSKIPAFTLAAQQERFRRLNAMVRDTNPAAGIIELIDGWYQESGGVNAPGSVLNDSFIPDAYKTNGLDQTVYNQVFKPYCRACHIAQAKNLGKPEDIALTSFAFVFGNFIMPHAEKTSHDFWSSPAPALFADLKGWSFVVTRYDDPAPGDCLVGDCSLREAILAANQLEGKNIITFGIDGTFTLTRLGEDDNAQSGDLDISDALILIGNGAGNTILDGNGLDRMFHILPGTEAVFQGITIQGGNSTRGGAIFNQSGKIVINSSWLRKNSAFLFGGGLANEDGAEAEINQSTLSENDAGSGGGIYNFGSTLSVNNSTISGNQANMGAGIFNSVSAGGGGTASLSHTTIAGNQATNVISGGGGLHSLEGEIIIRNSIVSGNSAGVAAQADCGASGSSVLKSLGFNLLGQSGNNNGCPTIGTDRVVRGQVGSVLNPNLAGNTGEAPYHSLVKDGEAVDMVTSSDNCSLPSYDQRNLARPLDGNLDNLPACDTGAVELELTITKIFLAVVTR